MREITLSIVGLAAIAVIFFVWSFFTGFEKWPWREVSQHWSGTHYGFTIGETEESAFNSLADKMDSGEIRTIQVFHFESSDKSEVLIKQTSDLREVKAIDHDSIWVIFLNDCKCHLGVSFYVNKVHSISFAKHFLLPEPLNAI